MNPRIWAALGCLVVGVPVAAWGLANGSLLLGLLGLALVLVFVFLLVEAMNQAVKPRHEIPKSPNAAWAMKDAPAEVPSEHRRGGSL
jgi:Na+-transporting methylmalonyl-CoA/oxaloacetate decarboxylase gamma subunit